MVRGKPVPHSVLLLAIVGIMSCFGSPLKADNKKPEADKEVKELEIPVTIALSEVTFDLPDNLKPIVYRVNEGLMKVTFHDLMPGKVYSQSWHMEKPDELISINHQLDALPESSRGDKTIGNTVEKLCSATTEKDVSIFVRELESFILRQDGSDAELKLAERAVARTRKESQHYITPGTVLTIKLQRDGRSVMFEFRGPDRPRFFQTYGLCYLRNGSDSYYTEQTASGEYVIRRKSDRSDYNPAGLMLVNYRMFGPYENAKDLSVCLAGALSFDGEKPVVGIGVNFVFLDNLGLFFGVAMAEETRLRGEYEAGVNATVLKQTTSSDQLVDSSYDETFIFGLSLNVTKNPFKK